MQENSGVKQQFQKAEFFRMERPGVYRLRILPMAPNRDGSLDSGKFAYTSRRLAIMYVLDLNNRSKGIQLFLFNRSDRLPDGTVEGGMEADDCCSPYGDEVQEALNSLKPIYREALLLQQAGGYKATGRQQCY
jgi:hypothetical protein